MMHKAPVVPYISDPALSDLHAEMERAFWWWNARHWMRRLPAPMISFVKQPPHGARLSKFSPDSWHGGTAPRHEIAIYADLALVRGVEEALAALAHAMVHLWQHEFGEHRPDRDYHNVEFINEAHRVGIEIDGGPAAKCSDQHVSSIFTRDVRAFAPHPIAPVYRDPRPKEKSRFRKYVCHCRPSPFIIRTGRQDLDATCNACGGKFKMAR